MNESEPLRVPTARQLPVLITGASSGIGAELARVCAEHGHDVALVARRRDKLESLAGEIAQVCNVRTSSVAQDLEERGASKAVAAALKAQGFSPGILVNNAGFGIWSRFEEQNDVDRTGMVDLNCRALTEMTATFLPDIAAARGRILNIASTAAYFPGPGAAVYYATKAYVLSFSRALSHEMRDAGVSVTAFCPGPVRTPFLDRAKNGETLVKHMALMEPASVARAAYRAMMAGRREATTGLMNRLLVAAATISAPAIALPFVGLLQMQRRK